MIQPKRLKILRVVTIPECVVWHMGKTLHGLGREYDVTVVGDGVSRYANEYGNVSWVDINIPRKTSPLNDVFAFLKLFLLCLRLKPDIVHSIMPKAGLLTAFAARISGIPFRVHTFTGQIWDTKTGLNRFIYKILDRMVVRLNTICFTDSHSQSRHLYDHGISYKKRPLPVLGYGSLIGVDLQRFNRENIGICATVTRGSLGLEDLNFVVAYIARKSRDKGAIDMLMGFALARKIKPNMRLLFIGPDESNGEIENLRRFQPELFEDVLERGAVTNHEEYLAASDLLCMPSYREGFGSVVIDAAALSVPCVGSRIVGLVDSIQDNVSGLFFEAGNIKQISDNLVRLSEDRILLRKLGDGASKRVKEKFSTTMMTELLINFYKSPEKYL